MFARVALLSTLALLSAPRPLDASAFRPPPAGKRTQEVIWKPAPEVRSRHYRILSDLDEDSTRLFAEHLDAMHDGYSRRFASLPQRVPEAPMVMMFASERDYVDVLRIRFGIDAAGSGGMFFVAPTGAGLAFYTEALPRARVLHVIQHEGFHQFAHSRFLGALPPWLSEGLAEYFGHSFVLDGRVVVGQATPAAVDGVKRAIDAGKTVPFRRMLTMPVDAWNENVRSGDGSVQYLQAWSMVQFLSWAEDGRYQQAFEGYLRAIHAGTPSERAFVEAFRTNDIDSFERAWRSWAATQRPSSFGTAATRLTFLAEGMRALSREGIAFEGFDDLLSKLRERDFSIETALHGRAERMRADEGLLDIPEDSLTKTKPVFELLPAKRAGTTRSAKEREDASPLPPDVTTRGLEPRELLLRWRRLRSGAVEYTIESPKEAPRAPKAKPADAPREKE
jgi:hypothetical protein